VRVGRVGAAHQRDADAGQQEQPGHRVGGDDLGSDGLVLEQPDQERDGGRHGQATEGPPDQDQQQGQQDDGQPQHGHAVALGDQLGRAEAARARTQVADERDEDAARAANEVPVGRAGRVRVELHPVKREAQQGRRHRVRALVGHHGQVLHEWPDKRQQHGGERRQADEHGLPGRKRRLRSRQPVDGNMRRVRHLHGYESERAAVVISIFVTNSPA
jgi:hypothetical protein